MNAPLPPTNMRQPTAPMTMAEAEYWIASHATWAEVWNRHERDRSLPLGPEWPEATTTALLRPWPKGCLAFRVRATGMSAIMRFRKFNACYPGLYDRRRNAGDLDRLLWAGWWDIPYWGVAVPTRPVGGAA